MRMATAKYTREDKDLAHFLVISLTCPFILFHLFLNLSTESRHFKRPHKIRKTKKAIHVSERINQNNSYFGASLTKFCTMMSYAFIMLFAFSLSFLNQSLEHSLKSQYQY